MIIGAYKRLVGRNDAQTLGLAFLFEAKRPQVIFASGMSVNARSYCFKGTGSGDFAFVRCDFSGIP